MSEEALDKFGEMLVQKVRDESITDWDMIVGGQMKSERAQQLRDKLSGLSDEQLRVFLTTVPDVVDTVMHHLMQWLEVEDDVEVAVTTSTEQIHSLRDVSDGLAGELYTEKGWISRFSRIRP